MGLSQAEYQNARRLRAVKIDRICVWNGKWIKCCSVVVIMILEFKKLVCNWVKALMKGRRLFFFDETRHFFQWWEGQV